MDGGQNGEQTHQRVADGDIKELEPPLVFLAADFVGTISLQPRGGFLLGQARGRCAEQTQHVGAVFGRRIADEVGRSDLTLRCQFWYKLLLQGA